MAGGGGKLNLNVLITGFAKEFAHCFINSIQIFGASDLSLTKASTGIFSKRIKTGDTCFVSSHVHLVQYYYYGWLHS